MKRLLPLLGIAALVVRLAACGGGGSNGTTTSARTRCRRSSPASSSSGSATRRPVSPRAPSGQHGHQPERLRGRSRRRRRAEARDLKRERHVSYVPVRRRSSRRAKKFDFAFQEATITAQRERRSIDFTTPYFDANQGVLLAKAAPMPHIVADLKSMQICAQSNTTGLEYIQHQLQPDASSRSSYSDRRRAAFQAVAVRDVPGVRSSTCRSSLRRRRQTPVGTAPSPARSRRTSSTGPCCRRARSSSPTSTRRSSAQRRTGRSGSSRRSGSAIDFSDDPGPEVSEASAMH